jgi:hypothetical protein
MSTQTIFLTAGATSKTVDIALVQKASATSPGDPITGLVFNTAGLTCYQRSGPTSTATAVTLATQTVGGAYSSGGFVEIDSVHMPGLYRFDIPNALIAASGETNITFTGAANLATHTLKIIVTALDFYNATQLLTTQMAESYAAAGSAPTVAQALHLIQQAVTDFQFAGTTKTVYKLDHATTAATMTLDSSSAPTTSHRSA